MNADERRFLAGNSGFNLSSQFVDTTLETQRKKGQAGEITLTGLPFFFSFLPPAIHIFPIPGN